MALGGAEGWRAASTILGAGGIWWMRCAYPPLLEHLRTVVLLREIVFGVRCAGALGVTEIA